MVIYFENPLRINKVFFAEQSFLSMFSISLIKGDKKTALNNVNTAVISETTARKLFGDNDPIGQIIETPDPYLITGVFLDMP